MNPEGVQEQQSLMDFIEHIFKKPGQIPFPTSVPSEEKRLSDQCKKYKRKLKKRDDNIHALRNEIDKLENDIKAMKRRKVILDKGVQPQESLTIETIDPMTFSDRHYETFSFQCLQEIDEALHDFVGKRVPVIAGGANGASNQNTHFSSTFKALLMMHLDADVIDKLKPFVESSDEDVFKMMTKSSFFRDVHSSVVRNSKLVENYSNKKTYYRIGKRFNNIVSCYDDYVKHNSSLPGINHKCKTITLGQNIGIILTILLVVMISCDKKIDSLIQMSYILCG
jgi:hypothetical protein